MLDMSSGASNVSGDEKDQQVCRNPEILAMYDQIAERVSFNNKPLALVDVNEIGPDKVEGAKALNKVYYGLGCLLESLAYQSAERARADRRYELALGEIGVLAEFVVQIAERNPRINMLRNEASENIYRFRGDEVRFWVGDFEYGQERVDFEIMVRPKSHEVLSDSMPGRFKESRQARLMVFLKTKRESISVRVDPDRTVQYDIVAPMLNALTFDNVDQHGAHHFNSGIRIPNETFTKALEVSIDVFDSMVTGSGLQ